MAKLPPAFTFDFTFMAVLIPCDLRSLQRRLPFASLRARGPENGSRERKKVTEKDRQSPASGVGNSAPWLKVDVVFVKPLEQFGAEL